MPVYKNLNTNKSFSQHEFQLCVDFFGSDPSPEGLLKQIFLITPCSNNM